MFSQRGQDSHSQFSNEDIWCCRIRIRIYPDSKKNVGPKHWKVVQKLSLFNSSSSLRSPFELCTGREKVIQQKSASYSVVCTLSNKGNSLQCPEHGSKYLPLTGHATMVTWQTTITSATSTFCVQYRESYVKEMKSTTSTSWYYNFVTLENSVRTGII